MAARGTSPRVSASSALAAAAVLIACCLSVVDVPRSWLQAVIARPDPAPHGTLDAIWFDLARALPVGELAQRLDLLATAWVFACALAATWAGHQIFRGAGRWWAAVAAGPITALALTHWHHEVGSSVALGQLPAAFTAMLAVTEVVRALVHFGFVPVLARSRAVAAAGLTALLLPRAGVPLLVGLWAGSLIRRRASRPDQATPLRSLLVPIGIAIAPYAIAAIAIAALGLRWHTPAAPPLSVSWPQPEALGGHVPALAFYLGLAMLLVLAAPLRWRGGPLLIGLGLAAITVNDAQGPLAPMPATLALLCVATSGWIWLAGSMSRARGRWLVIAATPLAVGAVAAPLLGELVPVTPAADRRPPTSIAKVYEKGLVAPGDAVFVFGPWLDELQESRYVQGFRPDVQVVQAAGLDELERMRQNFEWSAQGRRVLSDSYDAGGSWPVVAVLDSGPLFWFVGDTVPEEEIAFTDLSRFVPRFSEMPTEDRAELALMVIERARFRRAIDAPREALEALPVAPERRDGLLTRLALARSARAAPGGGSEIDALVVRHDAPTMAWITAEAADLMYAHGEYPRATELFAEAADEGYPQALGALARWQLRAGEELAAQRTLELLVAEPSLRSQAIEMLWWLTEHERIDQGRDLAGRLDSSVPADPEEVYAEMAARLRLSIRQAVDPPGRPSGDVVAPALVGLGEGASEQVQRAP